MDTSDPNITFDAEGVCHHCREYDRIVASATGRQARLEALVDEIKRRGRGRRYDCVMGISGGFDSSYGAYVAKQHGLRPLALHVDNGWNSELAVMNIENVVRKLGIDLVTHVIEWPQFRAAQLALVRASVVDIEMVTDHAIIAGLFGVARRERIPYILTGDNYFTEATLPRTWNHRKTDLWNLRAIHRRYGDGVSIKTIPQLSTLGMWLHLHVLRIRLVGFLSLVDFVKADAMATIQRELGWRPYGGKHYESIITRFYQGYILPTKFGIDKRRVHLSRLVCSGQMTREAALATLETSPYDPSMLASDREFVLKKFGLSEREFDEIMRAPSRSHHEFFSDQVLLDAYSRVKRALGRSAVAPSSISTPQSREGAAAIRPSPSPPPPVAGA